MSQPGAVASPPPETAAYPRGFRARRVRNWFYIGLTYAGYYLCRYNLSPVTPELAREFGLSNQQTGLMSTGRDFGYAIGTFVNGLFADALGGRLAMIVGAIGTIVLNLLFGGVSTLELGAWALSAFVVIRTLDGYIQSFGSPGMVKINASWFQRRERGKFSGIFGGMIQLGVVGVNQLSHLLLAGFAVTILGTTLIAVPKLDWRSMFIVPPLILAVIVLLFFLNVRNHPEDAGYSIRHDDDDHADRPNERLPLGLVFRTIASNPIVWINALAYLCTGFVRRASDWWWAKYLDNVWQVGKDSPYFWWAGLLLPIAGFAGSFCSGALSDTVFRGRRAPVGVILYGVETAVIVLGVVVLGTPGLASPLTAVIVLTAISLTCNSSHSVIGSAAVMDIGGRKMSGFALGVINSFQYFGAILAGYTLGGYIDHYGWNALFYAMIPFSALGMLLMLGLTLATRGRDVRGT